jgi:hypothetical protein
MFVFDVDLDNQTCRCCGDPVVPIQNGFYRHLKRPNKCALGLDYEYDGRDESNESGAGFIMKGKGCITGISVCPICNEKLTRVYKDYYFVGYCHSPDKKGGYDL